jgi:hypothetical protein
VGETVRKPGAAWDVGVQAPLRHLEAAGFEGAACAGARRGGPLWTRSRRCWGRSVIAANSSTPARSFSSASGSAQRAPPRPLGAGIAGPRVEDRVADRSHRRSISVAHARCNAPVASRPITGGPATPLLVINRSSCSTPSRSTGNETGSPVSPRSPVVNHTRLSALPGSIAITDDVAGTFLRNRSNSTPSSSKTERERPSPAPPRTVDPKPRLADLSARRGDDGKPPVTGLWHSGGGF